MNDIACPNEESLFLLAHGESASPEIATHLHGCPQCAHVVSQHRELLALLRQTASGDLRETVSNPARAERPIEARPAAIGKYLIVGELGRGGQAWVLRGLHPTLQRDVAIKWSHHPLDADSPDRDHLAQEGRLLADLDHPGLVRVFDLDVHEGRPYLVMEFIRGSNLEQHAELCRPTPRQAAGLVAQLARALAVAHRRGIIHQDIKPANVLIDDAGQPRLSDFGVARLGRLWSDGPDQPPAGTLAYMPAEQLAGQATPISDLYALGGVLFFLLTGQHPRRLTDNPALALRQVSRGELDLAPLNDPKLPAALVRICRRALAKEPSQRYQSAEDFARELDRFVERPLAVRRRLAWAAVCLTALALLAGLTWAVVNPKPSPIVVAPAADPRALSQALSPRVLRNGELFVPKSREDLDRLLPLRAQDRLGFSGTFPGPLQMAMFAVTLSDLPHLKVTSLGPVEVAANKFNLEKIVPLESSPASELIFACGSSTHAPTPEEVTGLLQELSWIRSAGGEDWKLPTNQVLAFDSDKVDYILLGRVGTPEEDPVRRSAEAIEQLRGKLRERYDFAAGLVFRHVPAAAAAVDAPRAQEANQIRSFVQGPADPDVALFHKVMKRLINSPRIRDTYPVKFVWPPLVEVLPNSKKQFNAYAGPVGIEPDTKKIIAKAMITEGYLDKVVQGDEEIMAAIMGHELAHITKKHFDAPRGKTFELLAYGRDQEIEADLEGVQIAVSAGYKWQGGVRSAFKEQKVLGDRSNFENLTGTHPSWSERLRFLDREEPRIWQAMSAFQNGYFFLSVEQYRAAENGFAMVVKDFPACAEAWANLGCARLMRYCDGLEGADVRKLGIGQIVAGCFYARPAGLVPTRGSDEELWQAAVQALETALKKDANLALAHGNLGLAHLVHADDNKTENLPKAHEQFRRALGRKDKGLDALNLAAFFTNYGVAQLAAGKSKEAQDLFLLANQTLKKARNSLVRFQIEDALLYNLSLTQGATAKPADRRIAFDALENYLTLASIDALWWPLAYERYEKLADDLKLKPLAKNVLAERKADSRFRVVTDVTAAPGKTITLSTPLADTLKMLGQEKGVGAPVFQFAKIQRYNNVGPGIDLLGGADVMAIFLVNHRAPPVIIQGIGVGAAKHELRVGMTAADLFKALGNVTAETRNLGDPLRQYDFFPAIGLAARLQDDRVAELVVVQLPRKGVK